MGYNELEASMAIERCGIKNFHVLTRHLLNFISTAQISKAEDGHLPLEEMRTHLRSKYPEKNKRELCEFSLLKRKRIMGHGNQIIGEDAGAIHFPNPMNGFGTPADLCQIHRTLPEAATKPPYFYYENVALTPKGVWSTISRFLYDVKPEFVDSKLLKTDEDEIPSESVHRYVLYECHKWNLVWVGKKKVAPREPDEVEMFLGLPRDHTRRISRTDRYKSLGNSFQLSQHFEITFAYGSLAFRYSLLINSLMDSFAFIFPTVSVIFASVFTFLEISEVSRNVVRCWWEQTNQRGNLYHLADVQELNADHLEHYISSFGGFDLLIGGSPCNNLAGGNRHHRDGPQGKESSPFYDYFRILDLVKGIMARYN
ncbi:DNA (cytosine-5)-methyltransferase DRM2-like [Rosa rugosa]|uniref:DNA (cytosine-5)-methyltransferase DRM2-like n=1 Tax=Rosa rugosa TaxID=74645 RepID=UPI002B415D63|nr:DNA (cytosine-5)-methyltransferase DRM2-like [Rosa rugosa]